MVIIKMDERNNKIIEVNFGKHTVDHSQEEPDFSWKKSAVRQNVHLNKKGNVIGIFHDIHRKKEDGEIKLEITNDLA